MIFALSTGRLISVAIGLLLLIFLVAAFMRYSRKARTEDGPRRAAQRRGQDAKVCPDCASAVSLDARICRRCGHRFA